MKTKSYNPTVDKLTLCYNVNENSYLNQLKDSDTNIDLDGFKLQRIDSKSYKNAFNILIPWDYDGEMKWHTYGQLKYHHRADEDKKEETIKNAWIFFENRTLYTELYPSVNIVSFAEYQSDILNMTLNNITNIEIAIDTSRNAPKAIKYMLRNSCITTILNGKVIESREQSIGEILYLHTGTLKKYTNLSIYVKQKDKNGFELKTYNKSKEIEESSGKDYIMNWHKINNKLFRIEVSLKNEHMKKYFTDNHIELTHDLFNNHKFLLDCFLHFSNRLLRFRNGENLLNILEIL